MGPQTNEVRLADAPLNGRPRRLVEQRGDDHRQQDNRQDAEPGVVIIERFKGGPKAMGSIIAGVGSFRWGTNTGLLLLPVVTLVQPILGVALSLTLLIQGYVSVRLGILEARSQRDLGIVGVIGAVLAIKGASWAFAIGVVLCLLIYGKNFFRGENDRTFARDLNTPETSPETPLKPVEVQRVAETAAVE